MDESPAIPPPIQTPLAAPSSTHVRFRAAGAATWVRIAAAATFAEVFVDGKPVGEHLGAWTPLVLNLSPHLRGSRDAEHELEIRCVDRVHTTNGFLPTIGIRWCGVRGAARPEVSFRDSPWPETTPAAQRAAAHGTHLLLDGRPFVVRGALHWGFYPELGHPWPDDVQMRREITELKACGFNLIKFCLWIPPPRYYELCDELGMLVWQEYPVWNAPLQFAGASAAASRVDPTVREFAEFFRQDRQYPCIILRTFTCENDHVSPDMSRTLVDLAHELIPGALVLDNSGWLCNEQNGDFHDEHPYVHNALWPHYGARMRGRLTRPLLLGETMVADSLNAELAEKAREGLAAGDAGAACRRGLAAALAMRRFQIETLARDLPDVGYTICGLRDLKNTPLGLYTYDGKPKYSASDWAWHREPLATPRTIPPAASTATSAIHPIVIPGRGGVIGPRKGVWKHAENTWWCPNVRVLDDSLPVELLHQEAAFELLSGRVLTHADGARVLVEHLDVHSGILRRNPLVIEFRTEGVWRIASAFRHDTPAGLALWDCLHERATSQRGAPPPEIGQLTSTSIVLDEWEMALPGWPSSILFEPPGWGELTWSPVRCDTPLINHGRTIFEGWAIFRARVNCPAGRRTLRCESIADYFELFIDGRRMAEFGPRHGTWDGTRDIPRDIPVELAGGVREFVFVTRDWRAAGGMVGPIYLAGDLSERVL